MATIGTRRATLVLVVAATVLAYFVLYAPQPLLPLFQRAYDVSAAEVSLLISAAMLPLAVAPLLFGRIIGGRSPLPLLRGALLLLGLTEIIFVVARPLWLLVTIRLAQGLLLPAVLTSITAFLAGSASSDSVRRTMSIYVASTIVGGYGGRLLAGVTAALLGWRVFFAALAVLLIACAALLGRAGQPDVAQTGREREGRLGALLGDRSYLLVYCSVAALFGVFAALLNYLPFRIEELVGAAPPWLAGVMYTGYALGIATSLGSGRIVARAGSDRRAIVVGYLVFIAALAATLVPSLPALFAALFLFCGAMFLAHAVSTGVVNQIGRHPAALVNGGYVTFYYAGGVLGTYLPGIVYERAGWSAFIGTLVAVATAGLVAVLARRSEGAPDAQR